MTTLYSTVPVGRPLLPSRYPCCHPCCHLIDHPRIPVRSAPHDFYMLLFSSTCIRQAMQGCCGRSNGAISQIFCVWPCSGYQPLATIRMHASSMYSRSCRCVCRGSPALQAQSYQLDFQVTQPAEDGVLQEQDGAVFVQDDLDALLQVRCAPA